MAKSALPPAAAAADAAKCQYVQSARSLRPEVHLSNYLLSVQIFRLFIIDDSTVTHRRIAGSHAHAAISSEALRRPETGCDQVAAWTWALSVDERIATVMGESRAGRLNDRGQTVTSGPGPLITAMIQTRCCRCTCWTSSSIKPATA